MTVKEMRNLLGLSQQKFGDKYHIPKRTIQDWEHNLMTPPIYVIELLERFVLKDVNEEICPPNVNMTVKDLRNLLGLSQQKFGDKYHIPLRTVQSWESGERSCPVYVIELLKRAVLIDSKQKCDVKAK